MAAKIDRIDEMSAKKVTIEGVAEIEGTEIVCICSFCNVPNRDTASLEFNFKEQKIFYYCGTCKKMNELDLNTNTTPPLPRTRFTR